MREGRKGECNDVGRVCRGCAHDIRKRRLGAERDAGRTFQRQQALAHQEAEYAALQGPWSGPPAGRSWPRDRQRRDGLAEKRLHLLGVKVFLENLELAAHPCLADRHVQLRNGVENEVLQALAVHRLRQRTPQRGDIVALHELDDRAERAAVIDPCWGDRGRVASAVSSSSLAETSFPGRNPDPSIA